MIDPDSPSQNANQFYLHWAVTNVPVSIGSGNQLSGEHNNEIYIVAEDSRYFLTSLKVEQNKFDT